MVGCGCKERCCECNTDYHLVCMKLRMKRAPGGSKGVKCRRFDVEKLRMKVGDSASVCRECWRETPEDNWREDTDVESKWSVVRSELVHTAEEALGRTGHLQPD